MKTNRKAIETLVGTALLAALVILLQFFVSIPSPIPGYTITLSLVPIMLGAILYGPTCGSILGGVFGAVVCIQVVTGLAGPLSTLMLQQTPVVTLLICMLKGILAGLGAGWIFKALKNTKARKVGIILSAVSCPLINTGIFVAALFVFYYELMTASAADSTFANTVTFILFGIVGFNFFIELAVNVLLVPIVLRLTSILKLNKDS